MTPHPTLPCVVRGRRSPEKVRTLIFCSRERRKNEAHKERNCWALVCGAARGARGSSALSHGGPRAHARPHVRSPAAAPPTSAPGPTHAPRMARHRLLVSADSLFAAAAGELSSEPLFLESVEPVGAKQFTALLTKHIALRSGANYSEKTAETRLRPPGLHLRLH